MKLFLIAICVSSSCFASEQKNLDDLDVIFLAGSVYSLMGDVAYCGSEYESLRSNADSTHNQLKLITTKIDHYFTRQQKIDTFKAVEKAAITKSFYRLLERKSEASYTQEFCKMQIEKSTLGNFPKKLAWIVSQL